MDGREVIKLLIEHGIRPSMQRVQIYTYLMKNKVHPTVDIIYENLAKEIPTLSKTTVYNTLNIFVQKGLAVALNIDNKKARYDADIQKHGHFKCEKCNRIFDFNFAINEQIPEISGFIITNYKIDIKGICKECQ